MIEMNLLLVERLWCMNPQEIVLEMKVDFHPISNPEKKKDVGHIHITNTVNSYV